MRTWRCTRRPTGGADPAGTRRSRGRCARRRRTPRRGPRWYGRSSSSDRSRTGPGGSGGAALGFSVPSGCIHNTHIAAVRPGRGLQVGQAAQQLVRLVRLCVSPNCASAAGTPRRPGRCRRRRRRPGRRCRARRRRLRRRPLEGAVVAVVGVDPQHADRARHRADRWCDRPASAAATVWSGSPDARGWSASPTRPAGAPVAGAAGVTARLARGRREAAAADGRDRVDRYSPSAGVDDGADRRPHPSTPARSRRHGPGWRRRCWSRPCRRRRTAVRRCPRSRSGRPRWARCPRFLRRSAARARLAVRASTRAGSSASSSIAPAR